MSFLEEIINEDYSVPAEAEAMRRGDSNAWLRRHNASKPRMYPSNVAGQWEYVPVSTRNGDFSKWNPPGRMTTFDPDRKIGVSVRQEDVDPVEEVSERINNIVDVLFSDYGE